MSRMRRKKKICFIFVFVLFLGGQGGFSDDPGIHQPPAQSPIPAKSTRETQNRPGSIPISHHMQPGPLKIQWPTQQKPSPKPEARQTPRSSEKPIYPNFFLLVLGGCQFGLSREAVPYLGISKGNGFLSLCCVLLGQPEIMLRRLREEHALFFY